MYSAEHRRAHGSDYDVVAGLASDRFGIDLGKYPPASVHSLLALAPRTRGGLDDVAVREIVAACCIGETMFMRHPEQLHALRETLSRTSAAIERAPLRVWSAGCATGEEAYSLAAVLSALGPVEVLGTDLDRGAIDRARANRYRLWSLRGVVPADVTGWLDIDGFEARVREPIRSMPRFETHNLARDRYPAELDVVLCRNVLLYFRKEVALEVIDRFAASVHPHGLLFLGPFDPVPAADGPWCEEWSSGVRFFRRRASGAAPPVRGTSVPAPQRGGPQAARRLGRPLASDGPRSATRLEEQLSLARALWAQGSSRRALDVLDELSTDLPLEVSPHVVAAMIADEAELADVALQRARSAYFLTPEAPIAEYLLAVCLDRAGDAARALRHLARARAALDRFDPRGALPHGEGLTSSQLGRMIDVRLGRS